MALQNTNPTNTIAWQKLQKHFQEMQNASMVSMFKEDTTRTAQFHLKWNDFLVDYSKNIINKETMNLLFKLADEAQLKDAIAKYFDGDIINQTENRAVLHTALRATSTSNIKVDGENVIPEVVEVKSKIKSFTSEIVNGDRTGYTGKPFTDVVNIGIGGSDLGPVMVVEALQYYKNHLNLHFVSNVDGDHVNEIIKKLNPETTLFVIVSKTFTTQETLTNSETIKKWFLESAKQEDVAKHLNLGRQAVLAIENGHRKISLWEYIQLSELFNRNPLLSDTNLANGNLEIKYQKQIRTLAKIVLQDILKAL